VKKKKKKENAQRSPDRIAKASRQATDGRSHLYPRPRGRGGKRGEGTKKREGEKEEKASGADSSCACPRASDGSAECLHRKGKGKRRGKKERRLHACKVQSPPFSLSNSLQRVGK